MPGEGGRETLAEVKDGTLLGERQGHRENELSNLNEEDKHDAEDGQPPSAAQMTCAISEKVVSLHEDGGF